MRAVESWKFNFEIPDEAKKQDLEKRRNCHFLGKVC